MDQKMVKFIKEQYPPGTRIRLGSMEDPYAPVPPGTCGTVEVVDDIGTIHMKWDNGRSLGIVPGEDSFSIMPPEPKLLKLYMPMTISYYERDDWGNLSDEETILDSRESAAYVDKVIAALRREEMTERNGRGLMSYYGKSDSVDQKVQSYRFTAEVRDDKLWGVAECVVLADLMPEEMEKLKDTVTGQASDGLGEGFEQHPIRVNDMELYAHLWQWDNWSIQTEQERFTPKIADGLPEMCFSTLKSTGDLICIKRGETGYYPFDWSTDDKERNAEMADELNAQYGVPPIQRRAMEVGSMFGFNVPGADPAFYEHDAPKQGGMTLA